MNRRVIVAVVWMMVIVAIGSSALTTIAISGTGSSLISRFVSEEGILNIQRYARLDEVRRVIQEMYYEPVDTETLMTGAIQGMMASLEDPYTFYYTPEQMTSSNEQSEGIYHGIGTVVQTTPEGRIMVVRVYENSPAEIAGLQKGDYIVAVDGIPVSGENQQLLNEALGHIQGEDGEPVTLSIERDGKILEVQPTRAAVNISYVDYQILDGNMGYISIAQFTGNDVTGFETALSAFQSAGVSGIIVDLRNNPGGELNHVLDIADMLLPEGLVVYTQDRQENQTKYFSDEEYWDVPIVVLVNGGSASASELFTAAVQDYDRGTIVGTQTFGKGIVQMLIGFESDGAGMQLTTASYYSPLGRSIHGTGIEPDIIVELDADYDPSILEPNLENDNQLACAVEELQKLIEQR